MTSIRTTAPINIIVYHPKTEEGKEALAKRVADAHTAAVIQRIKSLNCPVAQKHALVDAVIDTYKRQHRMEHRSETER